MTASSKEAIRAASRFKIKEVLIAEMGVTIMVREMVVAQRDQFVERGGGRDAGVWLVSTCIVDEAGEPIWSEEEVRTEVKTQALDLYAAAVMEVNGIGSKQIEAAAKNLTPGPSSASDTSSHSGLGAPSASYPTP